LFERGLTPDDFLYNLYFSGNEMTSGTYSNNINKRTFFLKRYKFWSNQNVSDINNSLFCLYVIGCYMLCI